jgi:hypothetical protein
MSAAPRARREAFSILETLVAVAIGVMVMGGAYLFLRSARVSTEATLGPQMGLQANARKALMEMIKEVQESIELVRPQAGSTLNYFVARDKLNRILTGYIARNVADSDKAGRDIHDLYVYRYDYGDTPPLANQRLVLGGIERAGFSGLSSGLLQIHLELHDHGKTYPILTTIRCRNILPEAEL